MTFPAGMGDQGCSAGRWLVAGNRRPAASGASRPSLERGPCQGHWAVPGPLAV